MGTINFAQGFMICLVSGLLVITFFKILRDKKNGTGGYANREPEVKKTEQKEPEKQGPEQKK